MQIRRPKSSVAASDRETVMAQAEVPDAVIKHAATVEDLVDPVVAAVAVDHPEVSVEVLPVRTTREKRAFFNE